MVRRSILAVTLLILVSATASASWFAAASRRHAVSADVRDPHLVAWYKLDGDATDSSGNENNGTWGGTESYTNIAGRAAAWFDGSSQIAIPVSALMSNGTFTAWINTNVEGVSKFIVSARDSSKQIGIYSWGETFRGNVSDGDKTLLNSVSEWTWVHVAMTWTPDGLTLWADATKSQAGSVNVANLPGHNLGVGARRYPAGWDSRFLGAIADQRIYNRALSSNDVNRVMNGLRPKHD